jgi:hypothetical protein
MRDWLRLNKGGIINVAKYKNKGLVQVEPDDNLVYVEHAIDKYYIEDITDIIMAYAYKETLMEFGTMNSSRGMNVSTFLALESTYFYHILKMQEGTNYYTNIYCRKFANEYHFVTMAIWRDYNVVGSYKSLTNYKSINDAMFKINKYINCEVIADVYPDVTRVFKDCVESKRINNI